MPRLTRFGAVATLSILWLTPRACRRPVLQPQPPSIAKWPVHGAAREAALAAHQLPAHSSRARARVRVRVSTSLPGTLGAQCPIPNNKRLVLTPCGASLCTRGVG